MRAARQTSSREPKVKIRAAGSLEPGSAFSVEGASEPVSGLAAVFLPLSVNRLKSPSAPSKSSLASVVRGSSSFPGEKREKRVSSSSGSSILVMRVFRR